jgi:hypothetical protein
MEVVLLPFFLVRPFRCENCGVRFYGLALHSRVSVLRDAKAIPDLVEDLPVLVYGRGEDEEPFREETNVHLLNLRGGLITLATTVKPGQQLILINLVTEQDQACHVAFVAAKHFDRSMIGIQFSRVAQEFWQIHHPAHGRSSASAAGAFWEQ